MGKSNLDPYNEENWEDEDRGARMYKSFFKKYYFIFLVFSLVMGFVIFLFYPNFFNWLHKKTENTERTIENIEKPVCEKQFKNFKVCYSKYYKKYAVKDLNYSYSENSHFLLKSYGNYYSFPQSVKEPTMFDDSCAAKQFIKDCQRKQLHL
jgi:hypothetical protein